MPESSLVDSTAIADIRADRTLLFPGPVAPLTHFGATLLRYSIHTALRYALYQLGLPAPEAPPTRFVGLRLYLDGPKLDEALADSVDAGEVLAAIMHPAGTAKTQLSTRLRGALWFHRRRLALVRPTSRRISKSLAAADFSTTLSRAVPWLGDALLGELAAAFRRRQARRLGVEIGPCQSPEASRFVAGEETDLSRLGPPDPATPSWNEGVPEAARALTEDRRLRNLPSSPWRDRRHRGGFRECYRVCLDSLRPPLLRTAARAESRGLIASAGDLFYVPMDLLDDFDSAVRPSWLDTTIADNRAEWRELVGRKAPADSLGNIPVEPRRDDVPELACLAPLP